MFEKDINGFGQSSVQQLEELNKALGTGTEGAAYGGDAYADMSALRPQSLEGTLKVVTAKDQHIKFWKSIGKKRAYNTVEEFNVLDSYGGDTSPFFIDGGLPNEVDSNYIRQSSLVKFLGVTKSITHAATLVNNVVGDIVARETQNGTQWLLQQLERALYFGDSSVNPLAFDGVLAQVKRHVRGKPYENQHIIDMKGQPLDENTLEDIATIISDNYGGTNLQLHMTNQVHKDLSKILYQRQMITNLGATQMMGSPVRGYSANFADIQFVNNIFLKQRTTPRSQADRGAPAKPTLDGIATPIDTVSDVASQMPAGTYYYFVSAVNNQGESEPTAFGTSVTVAAGDKVELEFNRVVSDPIATSYRIYRGTSSDASKAAFVFEVIDAGSGDTQKVEDLNFERPNTDMAFLIDNDPDEVLCFKQLAPLMKLPLARISAAERFMILLYGMVEVYNPRRIVVLKNIGKLGINSNRELFYPSYGQASYGTIKPVTKDAIEPIPIIPDPGNGNGNGNGDGNGNGNGDANGTGEGNGEGPGGQD